VSLSAGTRLGPYEILAPLGAGGMGEVYKARDTRLERTVAVKVLPQHLSSSAEVRQRFEREAKTISQLSHPHICALYDVGTEADTEYLVMEYLEGETLSDRLAKGPLPLEQTLRYGVEIADALDKAHRQGIVHRDLKPGNVMLTKSGVKLLDFGLAKALPTAGKAEGLTSLPTQQGLTQEGTILGTFQYMAPEQLEGKDADARTDIFAFGAVLYEMATGRKAFSGASQASLISSIMTADPPSISAAQPMSPPALERVVKTCLAKDPEDRWQSAADIGRELKWIVEGSAAGVAAPAAVPSRRRLREIAAWILAGAGLSAAALVLLLIRRPPVREESLRFTIMPPPGHGFLGAPVLSPDARRVLLILQDAGGRTSIATRTLDSLEIHRVPGTDDARGAFWSFDGREIAFFVEGRLKRVGVDGGAIQTICESGSGFVGVWGRDGTILFTKEFGTPIVAVSAAGGATRPVTAIDAARGEVAHFQPEFLLDGRHFVYVARNIDPEKTSVMLGSLDSKEARSLFHSDSDAIFAPQGYLLFARDSALFAWSFDPRRLQLAGQPVPVIERVRYGTEDNLLAASAAGDRLVYLPWSGRRQIVWVDRKGRELGTLGEVGGYEDVRLSPDGQRVAVTLRDPAHGQNEDLWVLDVSRGTPTRITAERTDEFAPAWFPDGERLVYVSDHLGFYDLYERPASGGAEKMLVQTKQDKVFPTVTADGKFVLYTASEGANYARILRPVSGGDPLRLSEGARFSEEHAVISPDGRFCAFDSGESGRKEVYVQPVPTGPKRQVSIGGGQTPLWSRDASELFYASRDQTLMSVSIRSAAGRPEIGEPQPLFPLNLGIGGEVQFTRHPYDVSPDGQKFLVIRRAPDSEPDGAVILTNWTAVLKGSTR
jgi:dipeptidyl aminopeptidase/acylaminoacyl peptidase/predicted Ser/Thr protein kinase